MTSKELTVVERAAVALGTAKHEQELIALVNQSVTITTIKNAAGRDQCHGAMMALKNARVAIEKVGKTAREDATAFSKAVIAEEKRLIAITQAEEIRLQEIRDEWDEARAAEKRAQAEAEANRIKVIRDAIEEFRQAPGACPATSSKMLDEHADDLARAPITLEAYMEFAGEAEAARDVAVNALRNMAEKARHREAEEARVKAELAELARLRAEQEERDRQAAAERAEHEANEARLRADREAHEANMRAQREELARQQAAIDAARRKHEEEVAAQRRAEEEARVEELRKLQAAEEKAAQEKREREKAENRAAMLAPEPTGGNWTIGKTGGCVVTDAPIPGNLHSGHDDIEYYGGYLICESVYRPADARLIAAAPALLAALKRCKFDSLNMSLEDLRFCRAAIEKAEPIEELDESDIPF